MTQVDLAQLQPAIETALNVGAFLGFLVGLLTASFARRAVWFVTDWLDARDARRASLAPANGVKSFREDVQ